MFFSAEKYNLRDAKQFVHDLYKFAVKTPSLKLVTPDGKDLDLDSPMLFSKETNPIQGGGKNPQNPNISVAKITALTPQQNAQEIKKCLAIPNDKGVAKSHINDHFDNGLGLTRTRGIGETFKSDITQESLLIEINDRLDNLNNIISTGVSKKGNYELILDMGRPINMSGTTNYITIWVEPADLSKPAFIKSIHPKNKIR